MGLCQRLQMQHAANHAVITKGVIKGAADVRGNRDQEYPAGPEMDVRIQHVEFLVLVAPVREFYYPPQRGAPAAVRRRKVTAQASRENDGV